MNIEELRRIAQAATPGSWMVDRDAGNIVMRPDRPGEDWDGLLVATTRDVVDEDLSGWADAAHIAAFNPAAVLELLNRLEAAEEVLAGADHTAAKYWQRMKGYQHRVALAEKELRDRELHHFEEEQARARAEAIITAALAYVDDPGNWGAYDGRRGLLHRILTGHTEGSAD